MKIIYVLALCNPFLVTAWSNDFGGASHKIEYEREPVKYQEQTPTNLVTRLQQRLDANLEKLKYDEQFGYLPALLEAFKIPRSSQMLVFSKTSLQRQHISPDNPRAIYFNDDVYIGYTPGAPALEISTADPRLGGVFYRMDNDQTGHPQFIRSAECLSCHGGERSLGVPGHFVRSIGTDSTGELELETETKEGVDQCAPLSDRWGGWYVTGSHGTQNHRGNLVGTEALAQAAQKSNPFGNLSELNRFFDVKKYPQPTSDITALMVLEHQTKMHNYITRLNLESQLMMAMYGHIRYLTDRVNACLRYLLFVEEAPLTSPIAGDTNYAKSFTTLGPFDRKGRSLREFDLQSRLFKYPCSYLIYSPSFDALPSVMREHLLRRLYAILTGKDQDPQFAKLSAADRQAILEILKETKANLPEYWER